jgi:light-independent protochlorophyllide reductase subunit B
MMGLEEHLLTMFRGDFEFHDQAAPSHLGTTTPAVPNPVTPAPAPAATPMTAVPAAPAAASSSAAGPAGWAPEAERELNKIPFFVRGKARRNTERYAQERQLGQITLDTLYEAKAHYAR